MDELSSIDTTLRGHASDKSRLLPILQDIQENLGYVPELAFTLIAEKLNISASEIFSVVTFYNQFRLYPLGKYHVEVCRGTACHIGGARQILSQVEEILHIKEEETSPDCRYSLDTAACFGCCALAPCLRINGEVHGLLKPEMVKEIFANDTNQHGE